MAQSEITETDWGAEINVCKAAIVAAGTSELINYTIAGRTFTKSKKEMYTHLEWLYARYNETIAGSSVTLADMSGRRGVY